MHTFAKDSYIRSTNLKVCGKGLENDAGLCYPPCPSGTRGIGPVCWGSGAPTGFPVKCMDIAWAKDQEACDSLKNTLTNLGIKAGVNIACIASVVATVASKGALSSLPAKICPRAVSDPGIQDAINLAKYGICGRN